MSAPRSDSMPGAGLHVFATPLGTCGVAWGEHGIVGIQLPERDAAATRRRLRRRFPALPDAEPPPAVADAEQRMAALLAGDSPDLSHIVLDMRAVPDFNQRVYAQARAIPRGMTLTYGELAARLGDPALARDVGQALGANPFPIVVPCHRVLAASGTGGFSAPGGVTTKLRMLVVEGAKGIQLGLFDT
jgi:methylated-DNA-[protein]-cysteine S-methyltransferase